ncbi:MAG: leucine-rich repeat protein [Candidatus Methanoplasma sp.]|nr:leucine-rich repeat protein [Candidatus Methanoplasma sp.]
MGHRGAGRAVPLALLLAGISAIAVVAVAAFATGGGPGEAQTGGGAGETIADSGSGGASAAIHTVSFDSMGGSPVAGTEAADGSLLKAPQIPSREGFAFSGWCRDADCANKWDFARDRVYGDATLYAKWSPIETGGGEEGGRQEPAETYTVEFDSMGGSPVRPISNLARGSVIAEPEAPAMDGFFLIGWFREPSLGTAWGFMADEVYSDMTLYAKWGPVWAVGFDGMGGSDTDGVEANDGSLIGEPAEPSREGYEFGGWFTERECATQWAFDRDVVTKNTTLYAKWTQIFTIEFDYQNADGGDRPAVKTVAMGSQLTLPSPERSGYAFGGWWDAVGGVGTEYADGTWSHPGSVTLHAYWKGTENLAYSLTGDRKGFSVSKGTADLSAAVVVPEYYGGKPVTELAFNAFSNTSISGITLPQTLTKISYQAFYNCKSLASVEIPSSVTAVDPSAFSYSSLNSVRILGNALIGQNAFAHCESLTGVYAPNVKTVDTQAFLCCYSLTSISLPEATYFGESALAGCILLENAEMPKATNVSKGMFTDCEKLRGVDMPLLNSIGERAFKKCKSLIGVDMSLVTSIGDYAFSECEALLSADMPLMNSIGKYVFEKCKRLESIGAPNVVSIGEHAFVECERLLSVDLPKATSLGEYVFYKCTSLRGVNMPLMVKIGSGAFYWCRALGNITIPGTVTAIGHNAFNGCTSLSSIAIPISVTSMGSLAFYGCYALSTLWVEAPSASQDPLSPAAGWDVNWKYSCNGTVNWGQTAP